MAHTLSSGSELTVTVGVDHGQFIACDPGAPLDIDSYDEDAQRTGIARWSNGRGITVFTTSRWAETNVTVSLSHERPAVTEHAWDHIVEGGLIITSGRLHIYGPEDTGINEVSIGLPSGSYSLLVCGRDLASTNEHGDDGNDTYTLLLWPGPPLSTRVLKDGFSS